jgi:S-DNA-T family DNA segregation ATPase FtsK/SpoIIIE
MAKKRKKTKRGKKSPSWGERIREFFGRFARGDEVDEETSQHFQEIKGLVLFGLAVWLFLSLLSYGSPGDVSASGERGWNWGGEAGRYLATWVFAGIGWSGYFLVFLALGWGIVLVTRKRMGWPVLRMFGGALFLLSSSFLLQLGFGDAHALELPYGPGGYLAFELAGPGVNGTNVPPLLVAKFGGPGLVLLLSLATMISFMLATEMAFYPAVAAFRDWLGERRGDDRMSAVVAVGGWLRRLFRGLWEFLRGTDLERLQDTPALVDAPAKKAKASKKAKDKKSKKDKKKKEPEPELFGEDEEAEEEEWEEEDEGELEEAAEDDEEWEYEYEYEYEEEEEKEEEELTPAPPKKRKAIAAVKQAHIAFEPPTPPPGDWKLPPMELLEPPHAAGKEDEGAIEAQAMRLENALKSFRVESTVVGAQVGPAVTMFELEVAQGTRLNKVTQLSQEIAAALRAKSVRIIAPIPGRATIGIEVPNAKRRTVRLSELVHQKAYDKKFASLPLFLGMDAEGTAIVEDLARMPHLLIAGTTGSGKSVCINTILASLLLTRSPHDVQLILVDPKMVEMQMFSRIPHLMLPVVSDMRQATSVLLWACEKMEGRYEVLKSAGVRDIKGYNALGEDGLRKAMEDDFHEERTPRHLPYIVIVIDEMADLMMTSKKEAEQTITRLAQKSRAVGIHVIVATQRPSTDVITGVLKGNLPTRIAFQVASKVDSRVILDVMGAEKLLGQGDMLYTPPQSSQIRRVQGALIEDHEIKAIVDFVSQESIASFNQELVQTATGTAPAGSTQASGSDQDDLFDEAVRVILKSRRGSASLLQRALGIGYTRASRLIDIMTAEGIVGEHKGSKAREVLMSLEDWDENQAAIEGANS